MASVRAVVDWVLLDPSAQAPVQVGDLLSADAGGMPIYRVTALEPDRVWLEDDRHAARQVTSLAGFQWKGAPA